MGRRKRYSAMDVKAGNLQSIKLPAIKRGGCVGRPCGPLNHAPLQPFSPSNARGPTCVPRHDGGRRRRRRQHLDLEPHEPSGILSVHGRPLPVPRAHGATATWAEQDFPLPPKLRATRVPAETPTALRAAKEIGTCPKRL